MSTKHSVCFLLAFCLGASSWAQTKGPVVSSTKSGTPMEKGAVSGPGSMTPEERVETLRQRSITEQSGAMPRAAPVPVTPEAKTIDRPVELSAPSTGSFQPTPIRRVQATPRATQQAVPQNRQVAEQPARPGLTVDERPLWALLSERRYDDLDAAIAELKAKYPDWSPPAQLIDLRDEARRRILISEATDAQDDAALIEFSRRYPQEFSCEQINNSWLLAKAYARAGRSADAFKVYQTILTDCPKAEDRMTTFYKASEWVSSAEFDRLVQYELINNTRPPEINQELRRFLFDRQKAQLARFYEQRDLTSAAYLAEKLSEPVRQWRDADGANLIGWTVYQAGRYGEAAEWFSMGLGFDATNADSRYGLALSQFMAGDPDAARMTLLDNGAVAVDNLDARSRSLLGEVYFLKATTAYQAREFDKTELFLSMAERSGKNDDALWEIRGWQRFAVGRYDESAAIFERLYRANQTESAAAGLTFSLRKLGEDRRLASLESELGGPLKTIAREQVHGDDFARYYPKKLFLAAYRADPQRMAELKNIDSPAATVGAIYRERRPRDDSPMGLKMTRAPIAEASASFGEFSIRAGADRVALRATKDPQAGVFPVGHEPYNARDYSVNPTNRVDDYEPYIGFRREGILTVDATIGTSARKKPLKQEVIWRLLATYYTDTGYVSGEVYRQPVRETILSYSGMVDPYTGETWGQVFRTGGQLTGFAHFGDSEGWNLYLRGGYERLTGTNVVSNKRLFGTVGLYKSIDIDGFDYFTIGPDVTYDSYDRNLNHYTWGHGGYYSPSTYVNVSGTLNFLSEEARPFVYKGRLSLGYSFSKEDRADFFPGSTEVPASELARGYYLSDSGGRFGASGKLFGVYQMGSYLQLGGGLSFSIAPDFNEYAAMLFLRVFLWPRAAAFSTDLAEDTIFSRAF